MGAALICRNYYEFIIYFGNATVYGCVYVYRKGVIVAKCYYIALSYCITLINHRSGRLSNVLSQYGGYLRENSPVVITGRLSVRDDKEPQIVINRARPMSDFQGNEPEPVPAPF